MSTDELVPLLDGDPTPFLLDVREPDEVADWHIRGAYNIPLDQLEARMAEVSLREGIVVICALGLRAQQGAQILASHGVASSVLGGGMGAWTSTYDQVAGDFGGARVVQIRRRGKGCLSYVVGAGTNCVVIDPSLDVDQYLNTAAHYGWAITHVLDTHLHADHISGARALMTKEDGRPVASAGILVLEELEHARARGTGPELVLGGQLGQRLTRRWPFGQVGSRQFVGQRARAHRRFNHVSIGRFGYFYRRHAVFRERGPTRPGRAGRAVCSSSLSEPARTGFDPE